MKKPITYKDAGVDIAKGNALVETIKPLTNATKRAGVMGAIGGFGGLFDLQKEQYKDPILVSGTDGVGTKLKIAIDLNRHDTIGIDLVAMCANDILVQGAQPLFFMDYFATGSLNNDVAHNVIKGISEGCLQAGAALLGGETAEMPDFYPDGHYDLAGFCVGAVERDALLPQQDRIHEKNIVLGLPSSGVHSNGYSLVRHLMKRHALSYSDSCPWDHTLNIGDILLEPTKIYVDSLKPLLDKRLVKALAHITGGGLTENIPRILPDDLSVKMDLSSYAWPPLFRWLQELAHITDQEMLKTFNCGIGMVLVVSSSDYQHVQQLVPDAITLGIIEKRIEQSVAYIGLE